MKILSQRGTVTLPAGSPLLRRHEKSPRSEKSEQGHDSRFLRKTPQKGIYASMASLKRI